MNLTTDKVWLIWSNEHKCWWAADRCGYVADKAETAGRYTLEEAKRCARLRFPTPNPPWGTIPAEVVVPSPELVKELMMEKQKQEREWCWPFCHDWGKWHETSYVMGAALAQSIFFGKDSMPQPTKVLHQVRQCKRCDLKQTQAL